MRLLTALVCAALASMAQPAGDVLLHQTFEADTNGWAVMGPGEVHAAHHALALNYQAVPKQVSIAVLPASPVFARMQRIRFRARSDYDTILGVILSEKQPGGGRYNAWFWSPANTWQEIELTPADFTAADGPEDPVDADGKLDTDSLQGIGILDVAPFFAAAADKADFPVIINRPSGTHTLQIEDFQILGGAAPRPAPGAIDTFDRGFLRWVTLGGMDLQVSANNPLGMRAMRARYEQAEEQFAIVTRPVANLDLSKAARLSFDIASEHEATMVVSLETRKGGHHHMTIYPPGGREVLHVSLKLADFEGAAQLDPGQLKSIALVDITAASGGTPATNTIWIGKVEMQPN